MSTAPVSLFPTVGGTGSGGNGPTPSSTILNTSAFTVSATFTPPPAATSPAGNGGPGPAFGSTNNPIGTSASLYLYTFLATLVLLLSVSAAIVVRSFLLRRRQRRMIEEAIRNGTWVPPAPTGRGQRVDLSKKPVMWEAYLGLNNNNNNQQQQQQHHYDQQQQQSQMSDEPDWESMKPFMVTYVNASPTNNTQNHNGGGNGGSGVGNDQDGSGVGSGAAGGGGGSAGARLLGRLTTTRRAVGSFAREVWTFVRPSPLGPPLPMTYPTGGNDTRQGSAVNVATGGQDVVPMSEMGPPQPSKVRVAVLIAMPRPHGSNSPSSLSSTASSTPAMASSSLSSSQIPPIHSQRSASASSSSSPSLEEEELPHIEMGVAELVISSSPHMSSSNVNGAGEGSQHDGKGKVRESMASVGSV